MTEVFPTIICCSQCHTFFQRLFWAQRKAGCRQSITRRVVLCPHLGVKFRPCCMSRPGTGVGKECRSDCHRARAAALDGQGLPDQATNWSDPEMARGAQVERHWIMPARPTLNGYAENSDCRCGDKCPKWNQSNPVNLCPVFASSQTQRPLQRGETPGAPLRMQAQRLPDPNHPPSARPDGLVPGHGEC